MTDLAPPAGPAADSGWDCHVHVFDEEAPVRPGHYIPGHRPLREIEAQAKAQGLDHLVLVQPSVYGTDNTVMLRALQAAQGRHRGVAVLDAEPPARDLDRLHEAGVRGIRFNLVSPAGEVGDPTASLMQLAPLLRERRWHVQWYVHAHALPRLAALQAESGLRFVLDHLAGLGTNVAADHSAWAAAQALADGGAWVKLSGWYRLGASAPYSALQANIQKVAALFGSRMVWGSDWPHTSFSAGELPDYAAMLEPARAALGPQGLNTVLYKAAHQLYA